jgi:SAM-dependent methyltransferase
MINYTSASYGEAIAPVFDLVNNDPDEVKKIVTFLRDLAGEGPALEPGIGTGRIAIPLAEAGVAVYGIEISPAMVDRLRDKLSGEPVIVEIGDMITTTFDRQFQLIYLAQGTFGTLMTAENQQRYLEAARRQLLPGGKLVIETMEIELDRFRFDQHVTTSLLDVGHVVLTAAMLEPQQQVVSLQNIMLSAEGIQLFPVQFRYYSAAQLDTMATSAGLRLQDRWGDWEQAPFDGQLRHISVYTLA